MDMLGVWFLQLFSTQFVHFLLISLHIRSMHEPAGVVENLVQILQNTPILQYRIPPPPMKIVRNLGTLTFQLQNSPPPPEN